ncbi:MAG: hypothetical protein K2O18_06565, partial [Oscillospiraceae bacterium]|nr:hypothetical protein [Oscillospiraceae bacterium]
YVYKRQVLSPFVAVAYLQTAAGGGNLGLLLQQDPKITVTFLSAMAGPFTAYLLSFAQKRLYDGDAAYMMSHLVLLFAAELLLHNTLYLVMFLFLIYLVYQMTGMPPLRSLRVKWKDHFIRDLSGCFVLILFAAFCLFVSLRLGM